MQSCRSLEDFPPGFQPLDRPKHPLMLAAVTRPDAATVATSVSLDVHTDFAPVTAWPLASTASAKRCIVSPKVTSVSAGGVTVTALTTCSTVTATPPDAVPLVAVIVAVPLPAAVTRPDASTVATSVSLDAHADFAPVTRVVVGVHRLRHETHRVPEGDQRVCRWGHGHHTNRLLHGHRRSP